MTYSTPSTQILPPKSDDADHICRYSVRIRLVNGSISYMIQSGMVTEYSIRIGESSITAVLTDLPTAEQILTATLANGGGDIEEWYSIGICRHSRWKPNLPMDVITQHKLGRK
jgi:hypothetical protein